MLASPEERIAWSDRRLRGGWLAALAALAIGLLFLPKSLTNNDEFYYAGQAYVLAHGRLTPQLGDPLLLPDETPAQAFRYPVAWPAVLALGRLFSIRGMYFLALAVHLLGGAAVARMLVRRGARSELAAAYLFHPVVWIYSRTLLSDVPATAAMLIAMDAWENRATKTGAAALGFTAAVRLANVTTVMGFGLAILRDVRHRLRNAIYLAAGVALLWTVQILVNHKLGGYWLVSTYAQQGASMFTGALALENLLLYLAGLALLPPFSLVVVAFRPRQVDRWALLAMTVVAAYIPVSFHNVSPNIFETLIGGQRYVLPAHAALLVATSRVWSSAAFLRWRWLPLAAGAVIGTVGSLAMARVERRHAPASALVSACRPARLGYNRFANRVAGSVDAATYELTADRPTERRAWDVLILAPGFQSHQPGFSSEWSVAPPKLEGGTCARRGAYAIYDFTGRCPAPTEPCHPK